MSVRESNISHLNNLILNEGYLKNKVFFERGKGSKLYSKRKSYIDTSFGNGTLLLGHSSKIYKYGLSTLIKKNISFSAAPNIQAFEYSKLLKKIYPHYSKFIFCNSGTEAIFKSLRICKALTV